MKCSKVLVFFVSLFAYGYTSVPLTRDYSKAKMLSQEYDKPLALLFVGSDWSDSSQKMLHNLIGSQEFEQIVGNKLIFSVVDFPELKELSEELLKENQDLKNTYQVQNFPTLIMTDPDGFEITRLSFMDVAPSDYATHLLNLSMSYISLTREYKKVDGDIGKIEELYTRASDLGYVRMQETLLQEGLAKDMGVFFPMEKYAFLVSKGEGDSKEAISLKEKILSRDPDNKKGAHLRLALLDFQSHEKNPEEAVKPLGEYIQNFGSGDQDNLWRLHLIISEYFHLHGKETEAKEHAEKSLKGVPSENRLIVQSIIDSLE